MKIDKYFVNQRIIWGLRCKNHHDQAEYSKKPMFVDYHNKIVRISEKMAEMHCSLCIVKNFVTAEYV